MSVNNQINIADPNAAGKIVAPGPTLVYQGPCLVKSLFAYNHVATNPRVVQLFDLARLPILGTDVPTREFPIPTAGTADEGTSQISPALAEGIPMYNGLAYAVVTAIGGSTKASAGDVVGHLDFTAKA
jgi:hypothetical protein